MNYIDYERQTTRKGELMNKEKPLIDYVNHSRRSDAKPEYQDGSGAIFWLVVCAVSWIIILCLAGHAGYFD